MLFYHYLDFVLVYIFKVLNLKNKSKNQKMKNKNRKMKT